MCKKLRSSLRSGSTLPAPRRCKSRGSCTNCGSTLLVPLRIAARPCMMRVAGATIGPLCDDRMDVRRKLRDRAPAGFCAINHSPCRRRGPYCGKFGSAVPHGYGSHADRLVDARHRRRRVPRTAHAARLSQEQSGERRYGLVGVHALSRGDGVAYGNRAHASRRLEHRGPARGEAQDARVPSIDTKCTCCTTTRRRPARSFCCR